MFGDTCEPPGARGHCWTQVLAWVALSPCSKWDWGALPGTGQLWGAACPKTPEKCPAASPSPVGEGRGLGVLVSPWGQWKGGSVRAVSALGRWQSPGEGRRCHWGLEAQNILSPLPVQGPAPSCREIWVMSCKEPPGEGRALLGGEKIPSGRAPS